MNNIVLSGTIASAPELRHTNDGLAIATATLEFQAGYPPAPTRLEIVTFGNRAIDFQSRYPAGTCIIAEGSLQIDSKERPEGFREKRAVLRVTKLHGAMLADEPEPTPAAAPEPTPAAAPAPTPKASTKSAPTAGDPLGLGFETYDDIPF